MSTEQVLNPSSNPYQKWLGISVDNPNYFQLLGVEHGETDKTVITRAARVTLQKLGESAPTAEAAQWNSVKRRIKRAYKCLSDPDTHKQYLAKLNTSQPDRLPNSSNDDRLEVVSEQPADDDHHTANEGLDTVADEIRSELDSQNSGPIADLPMAEVVAEPPIPARGQQSIVEQAAVVPVNVDTKKPVPKRRKSILRVLPVALATALLIVGIGYGINMILQNQDQLIDQLNQQQVTEREHSQTSQDKDLLSPDENQTEAQQADLLDDVLSEEKPIEPIMPAAEIPAQDNQTAGSSVSNESAETVHSPVGNKSQFHRPSIDTSWAMIGQATDARRLFVDFSLQQTWRGIQRNDLKWADENLELVKAIRISPQQLDIWRRLRAVTDDSLAFWESVKSTAMAMQAVDEFQVDGETISVIEAKPDEFVFRANGQRIATEYQRIPNLIALGIFGRGRDRDSADMLMARSLIYAIAAKTNQEHVEEANAVFSQASTAELPVDDYVKFVSDPVQPSLVDSAAISEEELRIAQGNWKLEFDRWRKMKWDSQKAALLQVYRLRELAVKTESPAERKLQLEMAQSVAEHCGDPFTVLYLFDLQQLYFPQPLGHITERLAALNRLETRKLEPEAAVRLIICYLELADLSHANNQTREFSSCLKKARQTAREYGLTRWTERLGKASEDHAGKKPGRLNL